MLFASLLLDYRSQLSGLLCAGPSLYLASLVFLFASSFTAMPDWKSQTELAKDSIIFVRFMHVLLGAYACVLSFAFIFLLSNLHAHRYEWLISLDFEWDFITGKKRFRWPMVRWDLPGATF